MSLCSCAKIQTEKELTIKIVRSDHGSEFENHKFSKWCDEMGIKHEFSAPKTPQQNGVAERKNRTLHDMANVMLTNKGLAQRFWAEVINTTCYVSNRVFLRPDTTKTPYDGRKPSVKYFKVFGSTCYVLKDRENLGKFDSKSDETIFLGNSTRSIAYRVFNKITLTIEESINVVIDDYIMKEVEREEITSNEGELVTLDPESEKEDGEIDFTHRNSRLINRLSPTDIIGDPS